MNLVLVLMGHILCAGSVPLSQLEPRQVLFHWSICRGNRLVDSFNYVAMLGPEGEIEFYLDDDDSGYRRISFGHFESQLVHALSQEIQHGSIFPEPIPAHHQIEEGWDMKERITGDKHYFARMVHFLFGSDKFSDPDRYLVLSHWILIHDHQHISQLLLLDRITNEIFKTVTDLVGHSRVYVRRSKRSRDGDYLEEILYGPDSLNFFGPEYERGVTIEWIQEEIYRGNIVPTAMGQHSIGVFHERNGVAPVVEVYSRDHYRYFTSTSLSGTDEGVGPIASFFQRRQCLETFSGFVDPDVDELVVHIVRGRNQLNVALFRNSETGEVRVLQKLNPIVRGLIGLFVKIPEWTVVQSVGGRHIDSRWLTKMIEEGDIVLSSLTDNHPVIEILTGDQPGFLVHSINRPNALYYPTASFNLIVDALFGQAL